MGHIYERSLAFQIGSEPPRNLVSRMRPDRLNEPLQPTADSGRCFRLAGSRFALCGRVAALERDINAMRFRAKYVSASENGDCYQVAKALTVNPESELISPTSQFYVGSN